MSVSADLVAALEAADILANADYEPENAPDEFVVVQCTDHAPLMTLNGPEGDVNTTATLICKGASKAAAEALAQAAAAAIWAATGIARKFALPVSADEFDPETMANVALVRFSIWWRPA